MPDDATFSIRDMEREFGLTLRTLRFYEERGLIRPAQRDGLRVYSCADRERLRLVTRFKSLGFPLVEVKEIIDLIEAPRDRRKNLEGLRSRLSEQREILLEQCRELERVLGLMDETLAEVSGELRSVAGPSKV
ncbi:MerR family transcriptional regulator [Jiella sonneratiae]|uniref:MerR family transcriptional regulator n=1 Tax=Jiella sonneratiae TaxID=2816856 RepID=A0ABS3J0I0_9HYPH|nr:MerR family transcriptional regulator [Jiella sonneratiae]MBO0903193.1 MerR family transcriptional regulator [Jiella sonneratiae]